MEGVEMNGVGRPCGADNGTQHIQHNNAATATATQHVSNRHAYRHAAGINRGYQWRKPGPKFGGTRKNFAVLQNS